MTNQTASINTRRVSLAAAFLLAAASIVGFGLGTITMRAQTPAGDSSSTAAPGTKAATTSSSEALAGPPITSYDNRWDVYGGLSFMNGQAGQDLPKRYDMGGGEVMGTYWLGRHFGIPSNHLGLAADYRFEAGTTPVFPQVGGAGQGNGGTFGLNRVLVYQNIVSGGLEYRGPKNRYVAIDFHALAGATHGTFDTAITGYPQGLPQEPTTEGAGLYSNRTSPWGAAGGSIDFNYSPRVAVRLSPDMIFEHFGTETREFFSISTGLTYRFGHLAK